MISQVPPPVHGSSVMTVVLLEALERAGRSTVLVDRRFSRSVAEVGRASSKKALAAVGLLVRLVGAIRRERPAVAVLFITNRRGSFVVDVLLVAVLRLTRTSVVHYVHTNGFRALAAGGPLWRRAVAASLGTATAVVVLGETLAEDVAPWVPRDRIVVVPNVSAVGPEPTIRSERGGTVLFFSNLLPEKGAHVAVDLGLELVAQRDDVDFVLAGADADPAYSSDLRARVRAAGAEDRVRMIGPVDAADRAALLDGADVLLFPSSYPFEAQPLTIVEAMAAGLPVVAYSVGGVPDIVLDGRTGSLVPVGDQDGLRAALVRLLDDPVRRAEEAAEARRHHGARHTLGAYAAAWTGVLDTAEAGS